jgi:helicase
MTESARFREWLNVPDELFITCLWRPTARRVAIWRNNNKLTWLYAGDELRPQGATATTIFGTRSLVWPERMYAASLIAQTKSQSFALYANAAYLCRQMHEEYQEPVLCVCASRASSRGVAYRLSKDLDSIEVLSDELANTVAFIDSYAPHLAGLKECLLRGIAFHNAALPLQLRQLIEKAVERRVLKIVCATTTLAEGVDLPFRVTVLAEWLQWRMDTRDQQRPFDALKFRNIAGRSGRAGVFAEGDTIVFENVLGPSKFVDSQNRTTAILSMMERPNEVRSALEEEVIPAESEARRRIISGNFLAAISENPGDLALERSFAKRLLFRKLPNGDSANQMLAKIRTDVLDGGEMAFAVAASSLRLTPLGEAANRSLLSPESCRTIIQVLDTLPMSDEFDEVAAYLLNHLGGIPEQYNSDWSKIALRSGSRFVVKSTDLQNVLSAWRTGVALTEIFAALPSVKKSKSQESVSDWLSGRSTSENWSNSFDKFADFIDAVIENFLPLILDACANLSTHVPGEATMRPWDKFRTVAIRTIEIRHRDTHTVTLTAGPLTAGPPDSLASP